MKGKLIKTDVNYLLEDDKGVVVASTSTKEGINGLSKQNCDEIFGVVDVEKNLYYHKQVMNPYTTGEQSYTAYEKGFIEGSNKAMELNKDKVFTVEDVIDVVYKQVRNGFDGVIDSFTEAFAKECINKAMELYQPTEIEVEIDMECLDPNCDGINKKGVCIPGDKPKIDSNGCLILKKL